MIVGNVGVPVTRRPHPGGRKGAMMSLDEVAKRAWAARGDPLVRAWTTQQLAACKWPSGRRSQAACVVRAFKAQVKYVEDPIQVEAMYGPRQTLCLDKSGLCVVGADCDDTTITLDACFMSIGWRVWIVGASYRDPVDTPTHVYGSFEDDMGQPVRFDGTTDYAIGSVAPYAKEWWIDPSVGVGADGLAGGEFVGVGQPMSRPILRPSAVRVPVPRAVPMQPSPHAVPMRRELELNPEAVSLRGAPVEAFGLGFVTPGDVLLYRNMWNDFVLDTVRVASGCSQAYASLSQTEQNPAAKAAETAMATSLQKTSDDLLALWNVFAGKTDDFIVLNGADVLKSFQDTVVTAGNVRATLVGDQCPMSYIDANAQIVQASTGPDTSLQVQVISRIEGLGILGAGVLQIMVGTAEGAVHLVGSAAQWAGRQAEKAANILGTPFPWIAVAVAGGAYVVWRLWPTKKR
jgi:hypothetical protein